ncbi:hypothetical protein INT43_001077 [Umbelopsis isabellina]|uniref:Uncharacterized protein n=1 Tax=Mortierella isabellina TaxID=91625 RepID=A0A8H7UA83_MORIS|nr:hypothetical protein INT43_001077 [Umbelopsis isabellina]
MSYNSVTAETGLPDGRRYVWLAMAQKTNPSFSLAKIDGYIVESDEIPVELSASRFTSFDIADFASKFNSTSIILPNLYSKGRVLGYERAKRNQNENTSLIQIEGVQTPKDAQFYLGKRIAFVYRAKREVNGSKIRVIWGRVTRSHGGNGVVKAKFRNNLPPKTFGASVRVMMYPSNV